MPDLSYMETLAVQQADNIPGIVSYMPELIQAGAIGLMFFVLGWAWWVARQPNLGERQFSLIKLVLVMSAVIIVLATCLEVFKRYTDKEYLVEGMRKACVEVFFQTLFDPESVGGSGVFRYINRAPCGLKTEISTDPQFQDFASRTSILRLWADPSFEASFIKAHINSDLHALEVAFIRKGYGCDVTIKSKFDMVHRIKQPAYLSLKMRADNASYDFLHKQGFNMAFRIRIIDGRGNHWVWGEDKFFKDSQSVRFSKKDKNGKNLALSKTYEEFGFDLSSRSKWALFRNDGSIAPIHESKDPFQYLLAVVIEPGLYTMPQNTNVNCTDSSAYHDRALCSSIYDASNSEKPLKFFIKDIYIF